MYYNFDLATVIRNTGGNYTAAHVDVHLIIDRLKKLDFRQDVIQHIQRSLMLGCPAYSNAESTSKNFHAFLRYGNRSSIIKHLARVAKTMTKEFKHCYVIPFPRCLSRLCPDLHLTPQGILVKQSKKPHMIWDGSFLPH